jgi:hypothetical protein
MVQAWVEVCRTRSHVNRGTVLLLVQEAVNKSTDLTERLVNLLGTLLRACAPPIMALT